MKFPDSLAGRHCYATQSWLCKERSSGSVTFHITPLRAVPCFHSSPFPLVRRLYEHGLTQQGFFFFFSSPLQFLFYFSDHTACGILVPMSGVGPPAVEAQSQPLDCRSSPLTQQVLKSQKIKELRSQSTSWSP